jgi:trimethyllysine dioxygenase
VLDISNVTLNQESVDIEWSNDSTASFRLLWLRDHCRHPESFNHSTHQRNVETFSLPKVPPVKTIKLAEDKQSVVVEWKDEALSSTYNSEFLYSVIKANHTTDTPSLWDHQSLSLADSMVNFGGQSFEAAEVQCVAKLQQYGLALLNEVEPTLEFTEKLAKQFAYIRETVFGGLWDFSNDMAHGDTAYTNVGIGPHTDGTYSLDPPGLQLLHCIAFDGEGGENIFVDGFKVAELIRVQDPQAFDTLTQVAVPGAYIDEGVVLRAEHPVIRLHSDGSIKQICFNNFDRAPFQLATAEEEAAFYHAYGLFHKLINDPAMQITIQMRPGNAVWFNNWRVLHARNAYTGFRHLAGAYINQEDFQSRLSVQKKSA